MNKPKGSIQSCCLQSVCCRVSHLADARTSGRWSSSMLAEGAGFEPAELALNGFQVLSSLRTGNTLSKETQERHRFRTTLSRLNSDRSGILPARFPHSRRALIMLNEVSARTAD